MLPSYAAEGAHPIVTDPDALAEMGVRVHRAPVARWERGLIRHDSDALARAVMEVYHSLSPTRIY